jgi:hypothetical protein
LTDLALSTNLLTGSLPSQLSAITNLHLLDVSTNQLSLRIPLVYATYLTHLTTFNALKTWICVPQDSAFLAWIGTVQNWSSQGLCHTISGHVTNPGGGVPNVTISDGAVHSTTSDATGAFTLLDLPPADYTLAASLAGHAFIPVSISASITNADVTGVDFHEVFSISGTITLGGKPLAGVTVADNGGHSATTGADGSYTLAGLVPGDYILTPSLAGYAFTPPTRSVTITNANVPAQDFSASLPTHSISGKVTAGKHPLAGVVISDGMGHATVSNADGTYTLAGLDSGDYTLTPSLPGYTFTPASIDVSITDTNLTGKDFTATLYFFVPMVLK